MGGSWRPALRVAQAIAAASLVLFGAVEFAAGAVSSPRGSDTAAAAPRPPAAGQQATARIPLARPGDVAVARYVVDVAPRATRRGSSARPGPRPKLSLRGETVPGGATLQAVLRRHPRNQNRFVLLATSLRPLDAPPASDPDAATEIVVAAGATVTVTRSFTVGNLFSSLKPSPKLRPSDAQLLSRPVPYFDLELGGAPRAGLRGPLVSLRHAEQAKAVPTKLRNRLLRRVNRYLGHGGAQLEPPAVRSDDASPPPHPPEPGSGPPSSAPPPDSSPATPPPPPTPGCDATAASFADAPELLSLTVRCAFGFASLSVILTGKAASLCESDVGACAIGFGRVDVTIGSPVGEALVVMLTEPGWRANEVIVGDVRSAVGVVLYGWSARVVLE